MLDGALQYVGHLAWLSATPKKEKVNRAEKLKDSAFTNLEPEVDCIWLVDLARDCGLYQSNGMGIIPTPWSEIKSWMEVTHYHGIWIAESMRLLTEKYVNEYHLSSDPDRLSPMDEDITLSSKRELVNKQFESLVRKHK